MGIRLSTEEKRQIKKNLIHGGFSVTELPTAETQPMSTYHNPTTGKELYNLPADPWNVSHYKARGLILGPFPGKLETVVEKEVVPTIDNLQEIINLAVRQALQAAGVALPVDSEKEGDPIQPIKPVQLRMI